MKIRILIICLFLTSVTSSYSQCPITSFTSQDVLCLDERLDIKNTSVGANTYEWDFCAGSALNTPTATEIITSATSLLPFSLKKIIDKDSIYVFVLSRATNNIVKYNFGLSLTNVPKITVMPNADIGGLLNIPHGFDFIFSNNTWYAIVSNSNGSIILLNFGESIDNLPTSTSVPGLLLYQTQEALKLSKKTES